VRCARRASVGRSALELLRPDSVEAASSALVGTVGTGEARAASIGAAQSAPSGAVALAGGTELVPLMREGIVAPDTLVDIRGVVPKGIRDGWIGGSTTLGELEVDPQIPAALQEACSLAASPQLRAVGTIAGNLLQATRCWYWRLQFPCRLHGGDRCFAREGLHHEHAIFANDFCGSAHPSDPAAALLALATTVVTDRRRLPLRELYRLPTEDDRSTTALEPGELILELEYEPPLASTYLKAMDRQRYAFAIVGVAAARYDSGTRLALAGVAPIPWQLENEAELGRATPLPGTAYKIEIAKALVRRALEAVS
jgi:xanthine dehydrogenase YagS FAD-binding subunit